MGTHAYSYAYDPIGNRVSSAAGGEAATYSANALNQYAVITNSANSVSPRETIPAYDLGGNRVSYGPRAFTWDAENRMTSATSNTVLRVVNAYDHQSRRIRKAVSRKDAETQSWELERDHMFLYDGWNLISECSWDAGATKRMESLYWWGLDW